MLSKRWRTDYYDETVIGEKDVYAPTISDNVIV